jgi:flagellar motor switch protein FliG
LSYINTLNVRRFKRGLDGVTNFAALLEAASPETRTKIIEKMKIQEPDLLRSALAKVLAFEDIIYFDKPVLAEVLSVLPPKLLAFALNGVAENVRTELLSQISFKEKRQIKDEEERYPKGVPKGLVAGAQRRIIKTVRQLESAGKIIVEVDRKSAGA